MKRQSRAPNDCSVKGKLKGDWTPFPVRCKQTRRTVGLCGVSPLLRLHFWLRVFALLQRKTEAERANLELAQKKGVFNIKREKFFLHR